LWLSGYRSWRFRGLGIGRSLVVRGGGGKQLLAGGLLRWWLQSFSRRCLSFWVSFLVRESLVFLLDNHLGFVVVFDVFVLK
jgi:hypothetical protein